MSIDYRAGRVSSRRWDRLEPGVQAAVILSLVVPLSALLLTDTDWIRDASVVAILVTAALVGWLRGVEGVDVPLD